MRIRPSLIVQEPKLRWLLYVVDQNAQKIVLCLLILMFVSGLGYSVALGNTLRYPDEKLYYTFARNLKEHSTVSIDGLTPSAAKAPGFSFWMLGAVLISNDVMLVRLLNYCALALSIWLVYRIVRRRSRPWVGVLSVLLCLGYPLFFYTASTLYPQTLGAMLLLLILYLADRQAKVTLTNGVVMGLLCGYLVLVIPTTVFLLPIFLAWKLLGKHSRFGVLAILLFALLANTPWAIRNYRTFHSFVFISTDGGFNLLLGNNRNTTPNAGPNVDVSEYASLAIQRQMGPVEGDRFFRQVGFSMDHTVIKWTRQDCIFLSLSIITTSETI